MATQNDRSSVWIHGISGKMGQEIKSLLDSERYVKDWDLKGGSALDSSVEKTRDQISDSDCFIDFSSQDGNEFFYRVLEGTDLVGKTVLIGSTGLTDEQKNLWHQLATKHQWKLMIAPNTSLGVILTLKSALSIAGICSEHDFDIEIEETHHRYKADAPSGTAVFLGDHMAEAANKRWVSGTDGLRNPEEIGIHATRGGGVFGEHKIRFISDYEEISIQHRAFSRTLFASGALALLSWLKQKDPGIYQVTEVYQNS